MKFKTDFQMCKTDDVENEVTDTRALCRAAALCSKTEYCIGDISEKLQRWGVEDDDASNIISYLRTNGYINHERFARSFVSDKFRFNKWGRVKIRYALKMKRIEEAYAEEALLMINEEEYAAALSAAVSDKVKKVGDISDPRYRAAIYNFCIMRGFESDLIIKAIQALTKK
ncbi:MAG: regulatory protein RecX [Bacteroidales bacterium]